MGGSKQFKELGGALAKWSKALLEREIKQKTIRSQVSPPAWAIFLLRSYPINMIFKQVCADGKVMIFG